LVALDERSKQRIVFSLSENCDQGFKCFVGFGKPCSPRFSKNNKEKLYIPQTKNEVRCEYGKDI